LGGGRGVKAAGGQGWPYYLHLPSVLKYGSLILLEPPVTIQGSYRDALVTYGHYIFHHSQKTKMYSFYTLLTVHLVTVLVTNQHDAQFFFLTHLFQFSTCFEQPRAHHQDSQLYRYDIWYMSLYAGECMVCRFGWNWSSIQTCIDRHTQMSYW